MIEYTRGRCLKQLWNQLNATTAREGMIIGRVKHLGRERLLLFTIVFGNYTRRKGTTPS